MSVQIEEIKTPEFTMRFFRFGSGKKTFVILPGLSITSVMGSAEAIIDAYNGFVQDYTVYVFDRRSDLPEVYPIDAMAEDTAKAFAELDLNEIDLFGASQGGMIALTIAARYPERIRTLIVGSSACRVSEENEEGMKEWLESAQSGDAEKLWDVFARRIYPQAVYEASSDLLKAAAAAVSEEDMARFLILAGGTKDFDKTQEIKSITCPTLLLGAKDDGILGPKAAEELIEAFKENPKMQHYIYEGYGHAAYDMAPDYKERILNFLKQA